MNLAFHRLERNHLPLQLSPISLRELLLIGHSPCDVYGLEEGLFKKLFPKETIIDKNIVGEIVDQKQTHLFVHCEDHSKLIQQIQSTLTQATRSLSVGNPIEKAKRQISLLTTNMSYLYSSPTDDETLKLQYQCAKNLASFLISGTNKHRKLFKEFIQQKYHYTCLQPLLSSLLVLDLLKKNQFYSEQEIENLFLTSYFKDIGMATIPSEEYDKFNLNREEKLRLDQHPQMSIKILKDRLPLAPHHLAIIENHHPFHRQAQEAEELLIGFETIIISTADIVSAMMSERPYRKAYQLIEGLEHIKRLTSKHYPQEFFLIVNTLKNISFDQV